jgi:chromosome segregation ATPase
MEETSSVPTVTRCDDAFDIAVRGYNRAQVQGYVACTSHLLASLEEDLAAAREDAQRAWAAADQAEGEVQRVRALSAEPRPVHQEISDRLAQILTLAAEEADQERAAVKAEMEAMKRTSEEQAAQKLADADAEAQRLVDEARQTAESELSTARKTADRELGEARKAAEHLRSAALQKTRELLDDARRRADAVNGSSHQRLEALAATHEEATRRLGEIGDMLTDLLQRDKAAGSLTSVVEAVVASTSPVPKDLLDERLPDDSELQALIEDVMSKIGALPASRLINSAVDRQSDL